MTDKKPLILVTNDDGITAPGIRHLVKIMKEIGDVVIVAPDTQQSGKGHAITVGNLLFCDPIALPKNVTHKAYSCSGTPADCVKIACRSILKRTPDLCVSGINHGSNSSINVIYSGTMSAAIEAGTMGIPAIGFSLLDFSWDADFEPSSKFVKKIAQNVLKRGLPKGVVLNVNIPNLSESKIKGVRVCRQAKAHWLEKFDKRSTPNGRDYYWPVGKFIVEEGEMDLEDTDVWALENGYVSIVPIQFDLTAHESLEKLKKSTYEY